MDDSASKRSNIDVDNLFGLYLKIEGLKLPESHIKQNKSVIKYTRLPEYELSDKASWSPSCTLEPRLRRIITIEEPIGNTQRSLRSEVAVVPKKMASDICKRKIVAIEEDDERSLHPKFSHDKKTYTNYINRAIETDIKEEKQISQRKVSRLSPTPKTPKDNKFSVIKKSTADIKVGNRYKYSKGDNEFHDYVKNKNNNEPTKGSKNTFITPKLSSSKKVVTSNECEKEVTVSKNKYKDESINTSPQKKSISEKSRLTRSLNKSSHNKLTCLNDKKGKNKLITIIKVPLDENIVRHDVGSDVSQEVLNNTDNTQSNVYTNVQELSDTAYKDVSVETDFSNKIDQVTETDDNLLNQCNYVKETFDSLDIPNVSLTNPKSETPKEEIYEIINKKAIDINCDSNKNEQKIIDSYFHKNGSYIISRATLTYTTKQKIDFHVVGNNEVLQSNLPSSQFPLNIVSVFKKEMKGKSVDSYDDGEENKSHDGDYLNEISQMTSIDSSDIFDYDKLMKPSDIISTIKVNDALLQSDYISEQFQRELNFIDSFFESLQYLESCSLTDKCIADTNVESWFNNSTSELKQFEDGSFLTKFENDVDDTKTIASRSLCLLNLLIRNEQRRAKNLLFVLKMREDALKNFTKSQILWLENKKGQENIDISTLKKKQRGALLKLQHECGEMQRMRKALLTLSEKRKLAFIKTKKNIELKLRNSADVDQIILGKKKLKRSTSADRNAAPLKCFELSSSGCDDSTTSRPKSNTPVLVPATSKSVTSAEKFVQTAENVPATLQVDQCVETGDESIIVVDGGYLNIVFRNFLPQIFSSGKQYEVNKEALKTMVHTSHIPDLNCDDIISKIVEQIKNHESDRTHTPSTARSLVDEFDQIYKDLTGEDMSLDNCMDCSSNSFIDENKEAIVPTNVSRESECDTGIALQTDEIELDSKIILVDESCTCKPVMLSVETQSQINNEANVCVSGPLPVPAGEAAAGDDIPSELANWVTEKSSTTATIGESSSSNLSLSHNPCVTSPVLHEAEELRRQQLAIEREIRALEEQQCQLLAVREIPDKPPPPYTPPTEPRTPKQPRKYVYDTLTEQRVCEYVSSSQSSLFDTDPYDMFLKDFCQESIQQQKLQISEKYWDTCNALSPQPSNENIGKKTAQDLNEVLTSVAPTVVSGVGARRSDHIDDILFAQWRRCEPEWTSLHTDEVIVKNQVFESIFQRILTETVDEYKTNVLRANNEAHE